MTSVRNAGFLITLALLAAPAWGTSIHPRSTGSYGQDPNEAFWDLSPSASLEYSGVSGVTGFQETVCPAQDLSGGACTSGVYDFLYQINSAPANVEFSFAGSGVSSANAGVIFCGPPQNTIALCTNTTLVSSLPDVTLPSSLTAADFSVSGPLPTYPAGASGEGGAGENGEGGLTFYVEITDGSGVPSAPTLTVSPIPAPEPAPLALLLLGLPLLVAVGRRFAN